MDRFPLQGKVALVTGSSRGIGRAIVLKLARQGAAVVVNFASQSLKADEVVAEIKAFGGRAVAVGGDVSKTVDVKKLFDETLKAFGGVDIVVNNAGGILYKPVADVTDEEFDELFALNVKGTFLCCREAANRLKPGGRIINFSSSTTGMTLATYGLYVATKGAVEQLSRSLAQELGPKKINVNVVSPGAVNTELFTRGKTKAQIDVMGRRAAFGRIGEPEEIADVVAFLAGEESRWITGQNMRVNGGSV